MGLAAITAIGWGQIKTTNVAEPKEEIRVVYDSSKVFLEYEPKGYEGEILYLVGKSESLREYGYRDFLIDYTKSSFDKNNQFRGGSYELLAGSYFEVIEVIKSSIIEFYLKLEDTETGDICYFKYNPKYRHSFPFIPVAYFNYVSNYYIGKRIVTRGSNWLSSDKPMCDMNTGLLVEFETGTIWTIVDVAIEEQYYRLSLILENSKGEKIPFTQIENLPYSNHALLYEDLKSYEGTEEYDLIINGKVRAGFTEEMVKMSWGEPEKINRSSGGDQWVYSNQYLYFENGIMTAFN